jgi:hypothetical protein
MTDPPMTDAEIDNPEAFPSTRVTGQTNIRGMSLRDWFAGQALSGWLASFPNDTFHPAQPQSSHSCETLAEWSYALADAMLKHRSGKSE